MTIHLTVPSRLPIPSSSPTQEPSPEEEEEKERANEAGLLDVSTAIRSAKRIVVLSGAGISVAAGIPDFRSSTGVFQSLGGSSPEESRRAGVTSGKELFDVSALNSPLRSSLHHRMLASLYQLASEAEPTPFHRMLKELDNEGRLLRVYTQNIDNLEERAGLTSGIPTTLPPPPRRSNKRQRLNDPPPPPSAPTPPTPTPRSIPLHGLLTHLFCPLCPHTLPLSSNLHRLLPQPSNSDDEDASPSPSFVDCPSCLVAHEVRSAAEMRSRGIGRMRAGVVLYGEEHPRGEDIGRVVERDLRGSRAKGKRRVVKKEEEMVGLQGVVGEGDRGGLGGLVEEEIEVESLGVGEVVLSEGKADLLIVVGTSLAIPGTKTLVREFGKVVGGGKLKPPALPPSLSSSVGKKGGASKGTTGLERVKTILLNLTPLAKPAETESMFDVFVQGDVQVFVEEYLAKARAVVPKPRKARKPKLASRTATQLQPPPLPPSLPPQLQLRILDDAYELPYQLLPRHSPFSSQASTSTSASNPPVCPIPTSSIPSPSPASSPPARTPSSSFSWGSNSPTTRYVEIEVDDDPRFKTPSKPKRERERDWEGESEVEESPTKGSGEGGGGVKPSNWAIVGGAGGGD